MAGVRTAEVLPLPNPYKYIVPMLMFGRILLLIDWWEVFPVFTKPSLYMGGVPTAVEYRHILAHHVRGSVGRYCY